MAQVARHSQRRTRVNHATQTRGMRESAKCSSMAGNGPVGIGLGVPLIIVKLNFHDGDRALE